MRVLTGLILVLVTMLPQTGLASDHNSQRTRHLAYLSLLQHLESSGFNQPKTLEWVRQKMKMDESKAKKLLIYAGNSYYQMLDDTRKVSRELLCPTQVDLQYVSENAGMLVSTIKDIQDSYLYTAYSGVLTNFDKKTFNGLNVWLEDQQYNKLSLAQPALVDYIEACDQLTAEVGSY